MATKKKAPTSTMIGGTKVTAPADFGLSASTIGAKKAAPKPIAKPAASTPDIITFNRPDGASPVTAPREMFGGNVNTTTANAAPGNIAVGGTIINPSTGQVVSAPAPTPTVSADRRDAFALLRDTFASYGLDSLAGVIEGYMKSDMGPYEASLKLKNEQVYKDRFKGNELRRAAGLNVLSEAEYLNQENTYQEVFRAYNQTSLLGQDKQSQRDYMANLMARDLSPYEVRQRFDVATTRVANADPSVKKQLQAYYGLSDNQMVSFVIAPDQTLADIQQKISTAEIGSAATQAGFGGQVSKQRAEELAKYGVDLQEARQGYQAIAGGLTQGQKIAQRYGGQYDMTTAEEELFKGNQQAAAKRKRFASLERAAFGGQSGITSGSLGKKGSGAF